jgi:hypothetical protein
MIDICEIDKEYLFAQIKSEPKSSIWYFVLATLFYRKDHFSFAENSLKVAVSCFFDRNTVENLLEVLQTSSIHIQDFLDLVSIATHKSCEDQISEVEIGNFRGLIGLIVQCLEDTESSSSSPVLSKIGYFKNILGNYQEGKITLENCIRRYGNNQALCRTLAESLLGMWDLSPNSYSGVDYSIIQDLDKFFKDSRSIISPLNVNHSVNEKHLGKNAIVFLSCDSNYFEKLAIPQSLSLAETSPTIGIHFHVMNAVERTMNLLERLTAICPKLSVTFSSEVVSYGNENSLMRKTYYASMRFCRAASFIMATNKPVIITDADQIFRRDIADLIFDKSRSLDLSYDVAIIDYQDASPFVPLYAKFGASFVIIAPNQKARDYILQVARLIEHNLKRMACWTLDQIVLLAIFEAHSRYGVPTKTWKIPTQVITTHWDRPEPAFIWNAAGPLKFQKNTYSDALRLLLRKYKFDDILEQHYKSL